MQDNHDVRTSGLIEQIAAVSAVVILVGGCILVLAPFTAVLLWGAILSYCTWTPYQYLTRLLGGRRSLAALILALVVITVLLGPFVYAGISLAAHADVMAATFNGWLQQGLPVLPDWIAGLPYAGPKIDAYWQTIGHDSSQMAAELRKIAAPVGNWLLSSGGTLAHGVLSLALSIFLSFFFYTGGEGALAWLAAGMRRVAGERADYLLALVGNTIKSVVYGILGTALAQGVLAGLGLWIAGVPGAGILGLATFFLSIIPIGPPLIWIPAGLWLFHQGETGWAIFMLVWGFAVISAADNVIKPLLISKGAAMPFILVMLGVLGGALAFGLLGVFIGPALLAVGYSVLREWTVGSTQARADHPP